MSKSKKKSGLQNKGRRAGVGILIVAAVVLETISCLQYFTSRAAIRHEAEERAKTELRKAELEIEKHTIEMETAAKALAELVEKHLDCPDSIFADTRLAVSTTRENTSMAVAFVPDYYPSQGRYFEVCSSRMRGLGTPPGPLSKGERLGGDSIYTRQIGSAAHDYTQMEWYKNGFEHDSCWWCEPYMDDSGSKTMVVSCSCPVYDKSGKVVAVVCVDLSLDYLQRVSEYLQIYNSYYSIRSSKGQDIVQAPDTTPGRKYNIFHEEIDDTGWHIEIIIPEDELFKELNSIGEMVGLLMLLGLIVLALIVVYTTRMVRTMLDLEAKNQRIENELQIASAIQTAMLPKVFPPYADRLDLDIYGMVAPAKEVGGDLYDFYVRQDKLFFCIGDVSGKGVPASLVMAMTRSLFRNISAYEEQPELIVAKMNRSLVEQNAQNMFLTLFLGVLDCKTGELNYCNAGHNGPVMVTGEGLPVTGLEVVPNLPLGIEPEFAYVGQKTQMAYDDVLFLYTDGLTEAENREHEQFGEGRMMEGLSVTGPRKMVERMQARVEAFRDGAEQSDDLTMLAIRYQTPALVMRNDIEQIPTLSEWIEGLGIPAELNMPINLALEEAVSNVMLYAYPGTGGNVFVEFNRGVTGDGLPVTGRLVFTISDSGIPFDPTQQKEADITLSAEEREIGGLGIHLVRQIMDEVSYERVEDKNVLTLVKKI